MIDFPANPTVGQTIQVGGCIYTCVSINPAVWSARISTSGIPDAPVDDKTYGRRNGAWEFITKATIGLSQVDNTSDANKPISTATASALASKEPSIAAGTAAQYWTGLKTWATLNPGAVGAVAKSGDTMTGPLTVNGKTGNDSIISIGNIVSSSTSGSAFYSASGGVSVGGGVNAAGGVVAGNGAITGAAGMGFVWDGGNANYVRMGSNSTNWSWQWNRATGELVWLGASSNILASIKPNGAIYSIYNGGGDSFYAQGNGGFRTDKPADTAFYAPNGGITVGATCSVGGNTYSNCFFSRPGNGYQWNPGYADNGQGGSYCTVAFGSPNYGNMAMRFWHQSGQYVGLTMDGENWTRWSLQSGRWIAAGYDLQSDLRGKTNLVRVSGARAKIAALTGYTYDCIDSHNYDGTPYRDVGIVAQELLAVMPEAVKEQLTPTYLNEDGTVDESRPAVMRYTINPMAVIATLVNDNNELAARIVDLEGRLAALEGA